MRIFNGEMIIGADGSISASPRGNYPDKWAVRVADLDDAKVAAETNTKIKDWFAAQNAQELDALADKAVANIKMNIQYTHQGMVDIAAISPAITAIGDYLQQRGHSVSQTVGLIAQVMNRPKAELVAQAEAWGMPHGSLDQLIYQNATAYTQTDAYRKHYADAVRNELGHALGNATLPPSQRTSLDAIVGQIVSAPDSPEPYAKLKQMIRANQEALKKDPVARIRETSAACCADMGITENQRDSRTRNFDISLNTILQQGNKGFSPAFRAALENAGTVFVVSPTEHFSNADSICPRTRYNASQNETKTAGGQASGMLPIIRLGMGGDVKITQDLLLEEGSHMLDLLGKFQPAERTAFNNLNEKLLHKIAQVSNATASDLLILFDQTRAERDRLNRVPDAVNIPVQKALDDFVAKNPLKSYDNVVELFHTVMTNAGYPNLPSTANENKANMLDLAYDGRIPWKEKEAILKYFNIESDINTLKTAIDRPSTLRFTYPPGSIRQNTMDSLNGIEFIGPQHYGFISGATRDR